MAGVKRRDGKDRRGRQKLLLLAGLLLLLIGGALRVVDPLPVQSLRNAYFDYLQVLSPREAVDLPVRVVDIDEASLDALGQWPWPRTRYAQLLDRLAELGVAVVAFDVLFAEPDRYSLSNLARDPEIAAMLGQGKAALFDNDARFAAAMAGRNTVLGVAARTNSDLQSDLPPKAGLVEIGDMPASGLYRLAATTPLAPPLGEATSGIGGINVAPQTYSGTIRQVPLLWQGPNGILPGLAIEALRLALGETTYFLDGVPGVAGAVQSVGIGPFQVPTDTNGQLWMHFRKNDPALFVSARDILLGDGQEALRPRLEGHIVFVGTSAAGLHDIRTTALGETVPGVSIHAQAVEQILSGQVLTRSDFISGLELLAFLALGLVVTLVMRRTSAACTLGAGVVAAMLVLAASWYLFRRQGILFDATFPVIGGAMNFAILVGVQFLVLDRDKRQIRRSFANYVAPEVLGEIEASGHRLELGGVDRDATVLFSDIRDFTPLSESLPAQELVALLNELFTRHSGEILDRQGTIDKFIGDSIMAFWNAPLDVPDHPLKAAQAALGMRARLAEFNSGAMMRDHAPIGMAVGIASGEVCVGNIGSRQRFNYTVIGDAVNMAARIEASCRLLDYDIAVSDAVAREIGSRLALLPAGALALKGITGHASLFLVVGDVRLAQSNGFEALRQAHANLLATLSDGNPHDRDGLAHCVALAAKVEPGLIRFYERLPSRVEDFSQMP